MSEYLDQVLPIAKQLARNAQVNEEHKARVPDWQQMRRLWTNLEMHASALGYDVLRGWAEMQGQMMHVSLAELAGKMIHTLYMLEDHPEDAAERDDKLLRKKDESYGASWKRRGGQGAFFVTVRKWDRLTEAMFKGKYRTIYELLHETIDLADPAQAWGDDVWDTVRDLRCYLLLWLAERTVNPPTEPSRP